MISTTRVLKHRSPSSFKCSIRISMTRSSPGWVTAVILPLPTCLRSSIQKVGAVRGLTLFLSVK